MTALGAYFVPQHSSNAGGRSETAINLGCASGAPFASVGNI